MRDFQGRVHHDRGQKLNPNIFFSNFSGASGTSRQNPGISRQKSLISLVSRDVSNFLAPTRSRGRPLPHWKISGPKSLGLGSFFLPDMKCTLWTETLEFWRFKVPNSRFALHGWAPPWFTVCALFLPLIHSLCTFCRLLLTPVSAAPPSFSTAPLLSLPASQFAVCTSRFTRPRDLGSP